MAASPDNPPTAAGRRPIVLASASPRRASLLREGGYRFEVYVAEHDEPRGLEARISPAQVAQALSYFKACSVADRRPEALILGGDTVVACGGVLYGKPRDRADAARIISTLSGTRHEVITGVTLLDARTGDRLIACDTTAITMRPMRGAELEAYLDTGAWAGKAGGYGIQDEADAFVTECAGSFSNVVGFPMELVSRMLASWGVYPEADHACSDR